MTLHLTLRRNALVYEAHCLRGGEKTHERMPVVRKKPADVTETELAILGVLWDRGPSGIRDIVEEVYGEHTPALHATVKSLLDRLAEKGYIDCDRSKFAHLFSAKVDRETYVGEALQRLADSHFEGSLAPMLLTLVERVKLTRRDRETLRNIIDNIRQD